MKKWNVLGLLFGAIVFSCTQVLAAVDLGSCVKNTSTVVREADIESFKFLGYHADDEYLPQCTTSYNETQLLIYDVSGQYSVKKLPNSITITRTGYDSEGKPKYNATAENLQSGFELVDFLMYCKPAHGVEDGYVILESCRLVFDAQVSTRAKLMTIAVICLVSGTLLFCCACCCKCYGRAKSYSEVVHSVL